MLSVGVRDAKQCSKNRYKIVLESFCWPTKTAFYHLLSKEMLYP